MIRWLSILCYFLFWPIVPGRTKCLAVILELEGDGEEEDEEAEEGEEKVEP